MNTAVAKTPLRLGLAVWLAATTTSAPQEAPESSKAEVSQVVGTTRIAVSYFSPAAKKKKIWGELLAFGENWSAGANEKTTISFDKDVRAGGVLLRAGVYGFYIFLNNDRDWQLVLSSDSTGGAEQYDRNDDVLRIAVTPREAPYRERLQFGIENFTDEKADLYLHWEKKKAVLQIEMTGERRGAGDPPEIPDEAKPAWEVAKSSLDGFLAEDIEKHIRDFADDFETDFGDGGSTGAHVQLLGNLKRGGLLEGMEPNLGGLKISVQGDKATFEKMIVYSALGSIDLTYKLEKRDGKWFVVFLSTEDQDE